MNIVRYMLLRLRTLRGMTVVHVGAHFGEEAARYERMLAKRVVWVEASPDVYKVLTKNIEQTRSRKPGVLHRLFPVPRTEHICINALVGEDDGNVREFHIFDNDGASNSMFRLNRDDHTFDAVQETGEVLSLPVRTLDSALRDIGVEPSEVDVLVLDTQGAELMCLKGATELLSSADFIETEVSTEPVYEGGVLLNEMEPWLNARGFHRKTMVRKTHMNVIFRKAG
ncbi:MAG: FkbM family methyltransferase [Planctomycetaceae bacterium]